MRRFCALHVHWHAKRQGKTMNEIRSASRLLRLGAENLATPRQPVRHEVVTHVLGTWCYLCVRAGQGKDGSGRALPPFPTRPKSAIFSPIVRLKCRNLVEV